MNLRFIDWIWHVRGSLALAPGQTSDDAFDRLAPLFHQHGTSHDRTGGRLTFRKKDQAAQDKMSVFDSGVLTIDQGKAGLVLRYHLISRALLFCFLAPLLFLAIAQLTVAVGAFQKPATGASSKAAKAAEARKKHDAEKPPVPQNPIDKALGAPAPEKPDKKAAAKADDDDKKPSPTSAYVFAGIFAALYVVGRILEQWLIKSVFRKSLQGR